MTCYYPRQLYIVDGKHSVSLPAGHSGNSIKIPCRLCVGCRLEHSQTWATRMMHEASLFDHNQFLTLSYDDQALPENANVNPVDLQLFWKRLRKHYSGRKLRYVAAAEYGENTSRPHYHAAVFGLPLEDGVHFTSNQRGDPLYKSKLLSEIWGHGFVTVGELNHKSAAYVASYMLRDIKSDYVGEGDSDYKHFNLKTGQLTKRHKPFARYSNRPGIGFKWLEKYYKDVFPQDCVHTIDGKTRTTPDYYFRHLETLDPALYAQVKKQREEALLDPKVFWNNKKPRLKVRETCLRAKLSLHTRGTPQKPENRIFVSTEKESIND